MNNLTKGKRNDLEFTRDLLSRESNVLTITAAGHMHEFNYRKLGKTVVVVSMSVKNTITNNSHIKMYHD